MKPRVRLIFLTLALGANAALRAQTCQSNPLPQRPDWPVYGGQPEGDHYSGLSQINRGNVGRLKEAWKFDSAEEGGLETSPIVVGRTLFAYTASQKVIALEASTGKMLWKFDSGIHSTQPARGLAYWTDGKQGRVLAGVMYYLYALDAVTGKPIASFGEQGRIDLRKNLRGDYLSQSVVLTSPGIVYQDLIIVGGRNPETYPSPPGDIRAFDVKTGDPAMDFSYHPASRRVRLRKLAGRSLEERWRSEQLGGDGARSPTGYCLRSHRICSIRFLWSRPGR